MVVTNPAQKKKKNKQKHYRLFNARQLHLPNKEKKKKKSVRTPNWKLIGPHYSSSADAEDWWGKVDHTSAHVVRPSVTPLMTDAACSTSTRIWSLLSLSRIVTEDVESTVIAKGTPSSSVLAYRLPIDVPSKHHSNIETIRNIPHINALGSPPSYHFLRQTITFPL